MYILDEEKLEALKELVLERSICNVKIEKVGKRYYCECDTTTNNNLSSKLMELHEILCEIELDNESITKFYLYYDQVLDDIIINKTIEDSSKVSRVENNRKEEFSKREILEAEARDLLSYFNDNQVAKLSVSVGKKKYNVSVNSIFSAVAVAINNIENTKNS